MGQPARIPTGDLTGTTVAGRYLLTGLLGRGGFGVVYRGRDLQGTGEVAVKVFSRAEGFAPRAGREARTASKLDHRSVHRVRGTESDEQHSYLISDLVVGNRFDRAGLDDEQAVRAIAAVCDALAHAHERNVVHRDVKPSNILVSDDGEVVLTDFGIARDRDAADQTMDEKVLGTLSYMAPEQARGEQATGKTDVWAAALTLYGTLAGGNPFRASSLSDLLGRLAKGAPPLSHTRPDLPPALSRTIARALDARPERRPTAVELRDGLLAALREEPEEAPSIRRPPRPVLAERLGGAALLAMTATWLLTAFPVYPPSWTAPIAVLLGVLAWRSPVVALSVGAALALPAVWNHSLAGALLYAPAMAALISVGRSWGPRVLAPLAAVPLAAIGFGPAFVLVAATAPTPRRRAVEGAIGGLLVVIAAGLADPAAAVAGADSPLVPVAALLGSTGALVMLAAMAAFAPLLALCFERPAGSRGQALALWTLGFSLATVALPEAIAAHQVALLQAAGAAALVGILSAVWALAGPRVSFGR